MENGLFCSHINRKRWTLKCTVLSIDLLRKIKNNNLLFIETRINLDDCFIILSLYVLSDKILRLRFSHELMIFYVLNINIISICFFSSTMHVIYAWCLWKIENKSHEKIIIMLMEKFEIKGSYKLFVIKVGIRNIHLFIPSFMNEHIILYSLCVILYNNYS